MDDALRNSLWNVMYQRLWEPYDRSGQAASRVAEGRQLLSVWSDHFSELADGAAEYFHPLLERIRDRYIEAVWWGVYDFVARIIYVYVLIAARVYLLRCYSKNVRTDLTAGEKKEVSQLAAHLKGVQ